RRVEPPAQCRLQIGGAAYSQPVATGSATGIPAHRAGDCVATLAMTMSPSLRGGRADAAILAHRAGDCVAALAMTMSPSLRGGRADAAILAHRAGDCVAAL